MGTNYYLHAPKCPCCGKEAEELIHLGKSSMGWCFSLHVYPESGLNNLTDMFDFIGKKIDRENCKIFNEYGEEIAMGELLSVVTERRGHGTRSHRWCSYNSAELGPFNLARHKVDGRNCIGHGDGTYDYIIGDFS